MHDIVAAFLLCAGLAVAVSIIDDETYESFISRTSPELCPYSTFCKQGSMKRLTGKHNTPCCTPCSCEDDCWLYDNCCPDHPSHQTTTHKSFIKCMIPIQFTSNEEASAQFLSQTSVYTVTSCPADYPYNDVSKMCAGSKKIEDLRDQATVSDRTGRVYKNHYCAQCHGKRGVKVWEQGLACQTLTNDLIDDITTLEPDALQNGECVLYSVAPAADKLVKRNRCYLHKYDTCNETGRWDIYNEHVERACAAYTGSYGQFSIRSGTIWYKNPYCYLCNKKNTAAVGSICPKEGSGIKVGTFSMSGLLSTKGELTSRQSTTCKNREIYDIYFKSCRNIHCPLGQAAVEGRCYEMFKYIEGVEVAAVFVVTLESTNHNASMDTILTDDDNVQDISVLLLDNMKVNLTDCYTCPTYIIHDMVYNDRFLVYAALRSKKSCTVNTILDIFHAAYGDDVKFTLSHEGGQLDFTGRITFDMYVPMSDIIYHRGPDRYTWTLVTFQSKEGYCYRVGVLKDFFYCPYVDLSRIEYQHLMNDTTNGLNADHFTLINQDTGHAVTNSSHGNSKESVYRVCTQHYIPERVNGGTQPKCSSFLCVVALFTIFTVNFQLND